MCTAHITYSHIEFAVAASAVAFLSRQACELGLQSRVVEPHPGMPVVIMTLTGSQPQLPSILLNSHMDEAPVDEVVCLNSTICCV